MERTSPRHRITAAGLISALIVVVELIGIRLDSEPADGCGRSGDVSECFNYQVFNPAFFCLIGIVAIPLALRAFRIAHRPPIVAAAAPLGVLSAIFLRAFEVAVTPDWGQPATYFAQGAGWLAADAIAVGLCAAFGAAISDPRIATHVRRWLSIAVASVVVAGVLSWVIVAALSPR
ncbi:MAG: hypothetical protein HOW97_03575 [Catenulispora sp.]|nr:hypothetical protein [Catenulispora sp.]NUR61002.1 hypothetical protein [Catenulispora sp.]